MGICAAAKTWWCYFCRCMVKGCYTACLSVCTAILDVDLRWPVCICGRMKRRRLLLCAPLCSGLCTSGGVRLALRLRLAREVTQAPWELTLRASLAGILPIMGCLALWLRKMYILNVDFTSSGHEIHFTLIYFANHIKLGGIKSQDDNEKQVEARHMTLDHWWFKGHVFVSMSIISVRSEAWVTEVAGASA